MNLSTSNLTLAPDAAIDLQTHTVFSDGKWTPEALIDHFVSEQFGLAAITDHDRVDTTAQLQQLAAEKGFPLLVAVEMSTLWRGEMLDLLCYGFDPAKTALGDLAQDLIRRQQENTREVYANLLKQGYTFPDPQEIETVLATPSAAQPHALVDFMKRHGHESPGKILLNSGLKFMTNDPAAVVDAAHRCDAVCMIAHPGRDDGFVTFNPDLLDQLRAEVPIDGLEVYYPAHAAEQTVMFLEYAQKHRLLTSSGSDSHAPDKPPIKYRAELSRALLERVGIQVK